MFAISCDLHHICTTPDACLREETRQHRALHCILSSQAITIVSPCILRHNEYWCRPMTFLSTPPLPPTMHALPETFLHQVWAGEITSPAQAEDEAAPRTVSMTWDDECNIGVSRFFVLKTDQCYRSGAITPFS